MIGITRWSVLPHFTLYIFTDGRMLAVPQYSNTLSCRILVNSVALGSRPKIEKPKTGFDTP